MSRGLTHRQTPVGIDASSSPCTGTRHNRKDAMSKFKWVHVHRLTYIKVDKDGNDDGKIYEYTGDHSSFCDGIEDEDLEEIEKEDA